MAPTPFIFTKPVLEIGATDYVGYCNMVKLEPADQMGDADTFETPGLEVPSENPIWTCTIDWKQSYGATGLWNLINAITTASPRVSSAFTVRPSSGAIGLDNPQADFTGFLPTATFLTATSGKSMPWTSTFKVIGQPVFTTS